MSTTYPIDPVKKTLHYGIPACRTQGKYEFNTYQWKIRIIREQYRAMRRAGMNPVDARYTVLSLLIATW